MSAPMARGTATLPTAAFLAEEPPEWRYRLLLSHAARLYREAAHLIAPRGPTRFTTREWDEDVRRRRNARASVRRRLLRLYARADEFEIDVGQPRPRLEPRMDRAA